MSLEFFITELGESKGFSIGVDVQTERTCVYLNGVNIEDIDSPLSVWDLQEAVRLRRTTVRCCASKTTVKRAANNFV